MKYFLLLPVFFLMLQTVSSAQELSIDDKIMKFLEISGSKKNFDVAVVQMISLQRETSNGILGEDFFDELEAEMLEFGYEKLKPKIVPIYKQYLAEEEIDGIIAFYESAAGKALVEKTPMMLSEMMNIGAEWGGEIALEIGERIEASKAQNEENLAKRPSEKDCDKFRIGSLFYKAADSTIIEVERRDSLQIERNGDNTMYFKIEWLSDCRYNLYLTNEDQSFVGPKALKVIITEVDGKRYRYKAKMDGEATEIEGNFTLK